MWRRSPLWVPGLLGGLLFGVTVVVAAPAVAADGEPSGWLELDAGPAGEVHRLTPGRSTDWAVDVQVRGEPARSLEVGLQSEQAASEVLRDYLSVQVLACSQPWDGGSCPSGQRTLMEPTALTSAEGILVDLIEPGAFESDSAFVLLTATLAEDAPREVQGSRTKIIVGVHGSGDDTGDAVPMRPDGPPSSILADTGARLGGFALLGLIAVAAGFCAGRLRGASA